MDVIYTNQQDQLNEDCYKDNRLPIYNQQVDLAGRIGNQLSVW